MGKWKNGLKFLIAVLLTPLLTKIPTHTVLIISIISALLFGLILLAPKKLKIVAAILWLILTSVNTLNSIEILNYPTNINQERLLWNSADNQKQIVATQKEALYLPYRLREIVFSKGIFVYRFIGNMLEFLSPENIWNNFGPVGMGTLALGTIFLFKKERRYFWWVIIAFIVMSILTATSRYGIKSNGFYPWLPLFLWLEYLGIR